MRFDDQIWEMLDVFYVIAVSPDEEAAIRSQPQVPSAEKGQLMIRTLKEFGATCRLAPEESGRPLG